MIHLNTFTVLPNMCSDSLAQNAQLYTLWTSVFETPKVFCSKTRHSSMRECVIWVELGALGEDIFILCLCINPPNQISPPLHPSYKMLVVLQKRENVSVHRQTHHFFDDGKNFKKISSLDSCSHTTITHNHAVGSRCMKPPYKWSQHCFIFSSAVKCFILM